MPDWGALAAELEASGIRPTGEPRPVGGGDIAAAWRIDTADGAVFLKTMAPDEAFMLEAEAEGLAAIAGSKTVRTPAILGVGSTPAAAWLALEWLDMRGLSGASEEALGRQLAAMHRHTADRFGWYRDNTIGRTPQPNTWTSDWVEFFREQRLGFQLRLAAEKGYRGSLKTSGERLADALPQLFDSYSPVPSLTHGDLWGGNAAAVNGEPVIFDPAVYFGDRETDLAMTRLFGGYGRRFYAAYDEAWPLDPGYSVREKLYQLYHVLNHLNLFGGAYLGRAEALIAELL